MLFSVFLHKFHIWEKYCFWDKGQNAVSQSDMDKMDKIVWFCACWYKFTKIKSWSKLFWLGIVKNGCGQSCPDTLELTVSQKWTDSFNWFFGSWCKSIEIKSWLKMFWWTWSIMRVISLVENWLYLKNELME